MLSKKEITKLLKEIKQESYQHLSTGWKKWDTHLSKFINEPYSSKPIHILELGVFEGSSSRWFLNNIIAKRNTKASLKKSFLYAVDTFSGSAEYTSSSEISDEKKKLHQKGQGLFGEGYTNNQQGEKVKNRFLERIRSTGMESNVKIIQMMTYDALLKLNTEKITFDIVYVDASHEGRDVIADAVMSWKLLKPGGIMIFDDYIWDKLRAKPRPGDPNPSYFTPKPAIDAFLYLYTPEMKVLQKSRQVIVEKLEYKDFEQPVVVG